MFSPEDLILISSSWNIERDWIVNSGESIHLSLSRMMYLVSYLI
jgi:hypothetical protein